MKFQEDDNKSFWDLKQDDGYICPNCDSLCYLDEEQCKVCGNDNSEIIYE